MRGNVASRIFFLALAAVLLAAVTQPGGIRAWVRAKFANKPYGGSGAPPPPPGELTDFCAEACRRAPEGSTCKMCKQLGRVA